MPEAASPKTELMLMNQRSPYSRLKVLLLHDLPVAHSCKSISWQTLTIRSLQPVLSRLVNKRQQECTF